MTTSLSDEILALRRQLPLKCAPHNLVGKLVTLSPLDADRDSSALFLLSNGSPIKLSGKQLGAYDPDELIWRFMSSGPFETAAQMHAYLESLACTENGLAMCVFERESQKQVGVATYMNNSVEHLKIELGNIWYSPILQGSGVNSEATFLMLDHVFKLGYRRVEWKCNALNERSRKAALRLGFKFEGIQEKHMIVKNQNRDTAWYRILDTEWAEIRERLLAD